MELIFSLDQIESAAGKFWEAFAGKTVFAFQGNMGAGKTTFISVLCRLKGVKSTVSSPTFSIINEYEAAGQKLYHLDLYRLRSTDEAVQAGVEDVLYSGNICFVEWPQRAEDIFPPDTVNVTLEPVDAMTRKLIVTS